jgi:hypothetical protein
MESITLIDRSMSEIAWFHQRSGRIGDVGQGRAESSAILPNDCVTDRALPGDPP